MDSEVYLSAENPIRFEDVKRVSPHLGSQYFEKKVFLFLIICFFFSCNTLPALRMWRLEHFAVKKQP
jgi:hypothetical protein